MSRVLLVCREEEVQGALRAALTALGHEVEDAAELPAAGEVQAEVVVVDNDAACTQGRDLVRSLRKSGQAVRVVWAGEGVSSGLGLVFTELPDAVISPPVTMASVGAALARMERHAGPIDLELLDLDAIDGPLEYFPLVRVLWAAHRQRASGRLELYLDEAERELHLRDGAIVGGRGFPDLLSEQGVQGSLDDDLNDLVSRAIAQGLRPDTVLEQAAQALGVAVAATVGRSGGMVLFEPGAEAPEHAFPLPTPVPRLLALGLRTARPVARVRRILGPLRGDLMVAHHDPAGPGGLPPVALRLWRAAHERRALGELVEEDDQAWLAADLLLQLGLATLQARPLPPPSVPVAVPAVQAPPAAVAAPAPDRKARRTPARGETPRAGRETPKSSDEPARSEQLDPLLADRSRLSGLDATGVLGISTSADLNPRAIDERFRVLSSRYHPDRFVRQPQAVGQVAGDCFAIVQNAYTMLRDPLHLDEVLQRMQAREHGTVYVSDTDRRRARLLYARGDAAFRRKLWAEAIAELEMSFEVDPESWRTRFLLTRARFESRERSPEECAAALVGMSVPEGRSLAELHYTRGEMLLAAGRPEEAFRCFEAALGEFPDHVEARRQLRLRRLREDGVDAVRARDAEERARRVAQRAEDARGAAQGQPQAPSSKHGEAADEGEGEGSRRLGVLGDLFKRRKR